MPRVFDNIDLKLAPAIQDTLTLSHRADFCVGYFNLRGWKHVDRIIDRWQGGEGDCCRVLVGMQPPASEELRHALSLRPDDDGTDNQTVLRHRRQIAEQFREQLTLGAPTNEDEETLRRLARQIRAEKVRVKLFLRYPLHAKLYLLHRADPNNPTLGLVGSSNLTLAGLARQGELNVDVLDHDACAKLQQWFNDRWDDRWCLDISEELAEIIEASWAREELIPPYHIYLKIAYHLSEDARGGQAEFRLPRDLDEELFPFQKAAVQLAARHLLHRRGVLIGDVVGLGKTLMATALARIFQDDHHLETLIICPKNLVPMWEDYVARYRMIAKVVSLSRVRNVLPDLRPYRVVLIDESHNLRNREGKRYRAIRDYIETVGSRCILLSATPYNKDYLDLSSQLRLFVPPDENLGIRPERALEATGEPEFAARHQCGVNTLAAFEKSEHVDDWRELMRRYMVRRTRGYIEEHYAEHDPRRNRYHITLSNGDRRYFPRRLPHTCKLGIDPTDSYARLFSDGVVAAINSLLLPRYGLANYLRPHPESSPTTTEERMLGDLSRAGRRLMGFCRTNLFKRLESGGPAFLESLQRHAMRNFVFLHAIDHGLDLPIGGQDAELLDPAFSDAEPNIAGADEAADDDAPPDELDESAAGAIETAAEAVFRRRAATLYETFRRKHQGRFRWLRPTLFQADLREALERDACTILGLLAEHAPWHPERDAKFAALKELLMVERAGEKVIVFTQFADTVRYLCEQFKELGLTRFSGVTGDAPDPTELVWRFSPESNGKREIVDPADELRVLIATDVLSEGQNLQDCHVVVNYDLPWAIIRLIQRAGRVDRIGQRADTIDAYSFMPADGVERVIRLRSRVAQRLRENKEVVGTDERFFEDQDEAGAQVWRDLYHEKAGVLDGDGGPDDEVDLVSEAYGIWKDATDSDPTLKKTIPELPNVALSARPHRGSETDPQGVLLYLRTADDNDALAWIDSDGNTVTQSQRRVLRMAECEPDTPPLPHHDSHHELVRRAAEHITREQVTVGGQLGKKSGARFRTYERLKRHAEAVRGTLMETPELARAIEDVYRHPFRQAATDTLNRQLRAGIEDAQLAELVIALRADDRLSIIEDSEQVREPQIICSLGLRASPAG